MPTTTKYTGKELDRYFSNPQARRSGGKSGRGRKSGRSRTKLRQALRLVGILAGLGLLATALLALYLYSLTDEIPSFQQLENPRLNQATVAYTADGEVLARFHLQNRTSVRLSQISPHVVAALVATEDHRFYDHWGVDMRRTLAIPIHLLRGKPQGGSTITQQLARNLYEQVGREVSPKRKLKEMITAVHLERNYAKPEIIEMYLNTVEFLYNAYGIEAAAKTYFNKPAAELNLVESATLVGMLQNPSFYNPVRFPERTTRRRNVVLFQMEKRGVISAAEFAEAKAEPIELDFHRISHVDNPAPHFVESIRLKLNAWAEDHDYNIYTDGLVVHTTIDSRLQQLAREALEEEMAGLQAVADVEWSSAGRGFFDRETDGYVKLLSQGKVTPFDQLWKREDLVNAFVRETEEYREALQGGTSPEEALRTLRQDEEFMKALKEEKTRLEAGLVAIDPETRHVLAWVGGRDYGLDKYDHVETARRQPGSTFKPFVYTAAIDNGYSPFYELLDDTVGIRVPETDQIWRPANSGGYTRAPMTLAEGLAQSKNTITAQLVAEIGAQRVVEYARLMGVRSPLEAVPSLALGTSDVTLLEMSNAYATLASGGLYREPVTITRIEDRKGNVLAEFSPPAEERLSAATAYTIVNMLRGTIDRGTGQRIRNRYGISEDVAGKTGTTQEGADGWFIMMHPKVVTGSWVGFNDRRLAFRTSYWGQGAHNALHIVGRFFRSAVTSDALEEPGASFTPPDGYVTPAPPEEEEEEGDLFDRLEERVRGDRPREERPRPRPRDGRVGW